MFRVSHTMRMVTCRQCKDKLDRGELRVDKGEGRHKQGVFHAKCVFDSFVGGRRQEEDIQGPGDVLGWDGLDDGDQATFQGYISQYLIKVNSNPSNSSGSNNSTSSSSTVITTTTDIPCTSTPASARQGIKRTHPFPPPIVLSDSESEPATPPKSAHLSLTPPLPVLPNLLEGVTIPTGPPRTYDECSVCLDLPVHPVTLPCGHVFCYLCAKGLTRQAGQLAACSLCRKDIPAGYLESAQVLTKASMEMNDTPPLLEEEEEEWQWFYEGRNGWWRFEQRNNEELEEIFTSGQKAFETMICGNLYIIDFDTMDQFPKNFPNRKRKIKRDLRRSSCKGVAGLQKRGKLINSE